LLASLQRRLIAQDIEATENTAWFSDNQNELKEKKERWLDQWERIVENGFSQMQPAPILWKSETEGFNQALSTLRNDHDPLKRGLILLELAAFDAYWPFEKHQMDYKGLALTPAKHESFLKEVSLSLGFASDRAVELRSALVSTQKSLSGYWYKVFLGLVAGLGVGALTLGLAAPFIATAIGGFMGLSGAAAYSAGLAALGGGAIAAGGFGMSGGMVVLVGGGAILFAGLGGAGGRIAVSMTAASALLSAAKLEVILKEFILQGQKDMAKVQEILLAQRRCIQELENELDRLRVAGSTNSERISELEKAITILQTALKRNQGLAAA